MAIIIQPENIINDLLVGQQNQVDVEAVYKTNDVLPSLRSPSEYYEAGALKFKMSSDKTYFICTGVSDYAGGAIEIPKEYTYIPDAGGDPTTLPVKEIGDKAFEYLHVANVTFEGAPDKCNIKKIGSSAFANTNITSIDIPSSVEEIARGAFYSCSSLADVTFREGLKKIGGLAFAFCPVLNSKINFPNTLTTISDEIFAHSGVTEIVVGSGMTELPDYAFSLCASLTKVTLGENVTRIGSYAFYKNTSLTSVTIPSGVNWIGKKAFAGCENLVSAVFGNAHGWFYTDLDSKPDVIISGENCENIFSPSASLLRLNFAEKSWFRIGQIPTPTISLKDGVLTMTDYSGLADRFKIYLNDKLLREVYAQPIITAGTWTARDTFYFPETEMVQKISFTSSYGVVSEFYGMKLDKVGPGNTPDLLCYLSEFPENGDLGSATAAMVYFPDFAGMDNFGPDGWSSADAKTVVIANDTLVSAEFYDWFVSAFDKQAG